MMFIDTLFAEFVHTLNVVGGGFFSPLFKLITLLGEKSWFFLLIAAFLCMRKKTRWIGFTIILSIAIGFVSADFILKPLIARPRPYQSSIDIFYTFWKDAGAIREKGFSMPSGHTLGAAAFFISLYFTCRREYKKNIVIYGLIVVFFMTMSRCYFMHHYFTDCLAAIFFAFICAIISKIIVKLAYRICKYYENIPLFNFALNFDISDMFMRKK